MSTYNQNLVEEVRRSIFRHGWQTAIREKEENGILYFSLEEEPFMHVENDQLYVRCFPEDTDTYLDEPGIYRYEKDGRIGVMGWLRITPQVYLIRENLDNWLQVSYNYVSTELHHRHQEHGRL